MVKCKELSRLSKLASAKYVNFRRQTPGSIGDIFTFGRCTNYLDPSHPARNLPKRLFPDFRSPALEVKAFPFALLSNPETLWTSPFNVTFDTWMDRVERLANSDVTPDNETLVAPVMLHDLKKNSIPMSLVSLAGKKRTSNRRHIRHKIVSRLKIAINLIVTRGANVEVVNGKPKLVMNEKEAEEMSDKWISMGWTYIFVPTMEIYQMPYYDMVPILREALRQVYDHSQRLEVQWASPPKKATSNKIKNGYSARKDSIEKTPTRTVTTYAPIQAVHSHAFSKIHSSTAFPEYKVHASLRSYSTYRRDRSSGSAKVASDGKCSHMQKDDRSIKSDRIPTYNRRSTNAKSEPKSPVVRLGGVKFNGTPPPIPTYRRMARDNAPKQVFSAPRQDDARIQMITAEREQAAILLGNSSKMVPLREHRSRIKNRIALREAKRREPLGPEFIGFSSQPNPSFDPFTDVEIRFGEGPKPVRKALIDLLKKNSARMPPRATRHHSPRITDRLDKSSMPDEFGPFSPLMQAGDDFATSTSDNFGQDHLEPTFPTSPSDNTPLDALDFDPFAPRSTYAPQPRQPSTSSFRNVSPEEAGRIEHVLQEYDPFHAEQTNGADDGMASSVSSLNAISPSSRQRARSSNSFRHDKASRHERSVRARRLRKILYRTKPIFKKWMRKHQPSLPPNP